MHGIENIRSNRFDVTIQARLRTAHAEFHGTIDNISATGAGFQRSFVQLKTGERVAITTTECGVLCGIVQWRSSTGFGVQFDRKALGGGE